MRLLQFLKITLPCYTIFTTLITVDGLFINFAIGAVHHPFPMGEGGGTGLWPRSCVFLEILLMYISNFLEYL